MRNKLPPGRRRAGLVDLENLTIFDGMRLALPDALAVVGEIAELTRGMPVRAAMGASLLRAYAASLSTSRWGIDAVHVAPDAADRLLLARGQEFVDAGCTDLVVVSGDHAFAELAAMAQLHVVSFPARLSRRLRRHASKVTLLDAAHLTLAA